MNFTLTAYPDSRSDIEFDPYLNGAALTVARMTNEPLKDIEPCECGSNCILWISRDHKKPEIVFSGVVCLNPSCTVLMVTVATDEDAV